MSDTRETFSLSPDDEYNRRLVHQVHPPAWENPRPPGRYNLVVVGAGTAGLVTAAGAAGLGAKVALIEKDLMGGDCLNVGCVPSKALLSASRQLVSCRQAADYGQAVAAPCDVDFPAIMERMRRLRAEISPNDSAERFRKLGVDVYLGTAKFVSPHSLTVAGTQLSFRKACIATGARAVAVSIPGLSEAGFLTNESLFSITELPRQLAILGGGPIGCEMAQAFARFGSEVTLIERGERLLARDDPDAARLIQQSLEADGVRIMLSAEVTRVESEGGKKRLQVRGGASEIVVPADEILLSAGRAPNVEGLGLEEIGVHFDRRQGIQVNERLQTSVPHIFAAGDVCTPLKFTHHADFMARIVIQNSLFLGRAKVGKLIVPWCTYTSPELAHVGLLPEQAREQGIKITTLTQPLSEVDRAILDGETRGFVRVHLKKGTDRIIGATVVGPHAGDLIGELTLAIQHRIGLKKIGATIHPYPTQADAIRRLGDAYNRTRLKPWIGNLLRWWLARSR